MPAQITESNSLSIPCQEIFSLISGVEVSHKFLRYISIFYCKINGLYFESYGKHVGTVQITLLLCLYMFYR